MSFFGGTWAVSTLISKAPAEKSGKMEQHSLLLVLCFSSPTNQIHVHNVYIKEIITN